MFQTVSTFLPELFLAVTASFLLGFGLSKNSDRSIIVRYISAGILIAVSYTHLTLPTICSV